MVVQIYEIQRVWEAERCVELGVDHVGSVVLDRDEWRQPELRETIRVLEGTGVKSSIIPLFKGMDDISRLLDYYRPDFIHLCENLTDHHGREMDFSGAIQLQSEIRERFPGVGIIRSIPIPLNGFAAGFPTLPIAKNLEPVSDLFLTDTWLGKEPVEGFIGITGRRCDQQIARDLVALSRIPVILAGGLSPENVYDALMDVRAAGADSCTRTNEVDEDGNPVRFKKDFVKVKHFVEEVRRAERDGGRAS